MVISRSSNREPLWRLSKGSARALLDRAVCGKEAQCSGPELPTAAPKIRSGPAVAGPDLASRHRGRFPWDLRSVQDSVAHQKGCLSPLWRDLLEITSGRKLRRTAQPGRLR